MVAIVSGAKQMKVDNLEKAPKEDEENDEDDDDVEDIENDKDFEVDKVQVDKDKV